ncbi:MAG: prepilin-type N-terminal cleavage/methylation domain-containing protein, partial [Parcubacteria group bacterium]|nr:prepilin-type N-terminal cleavage/methylation domain-containing protein [Parcubacteria group bacterium]
MSASNKQGFGLLEIVISSAILAVGILGLLSAFPRGVSIEKNLEHVTVA